MYIVCVDGIIEKGMCEFRKVILCKTVLEQGLLAEVVRHDLFCIKFEGAALPDWDQLPSDGAHIGHTSGPGALFQPGQTSGPPVPGHTSGPGTASNARNDEPGPSPRHNLRKVSPSLRIIFTVSTLFFRTTRRGHDRVRFLSPRQCSAEGWRLPCKASS